MTTDAESPAGRRWRVVATALRADLRRGDIGAGARLPPEATLATRFGVSRFTIRRALSDLEQDGLLRVEHGRGIFASDDLFPYPIGERTRFTQALRDAALTPGRRVLGETIVTADAAAARALGVAPGDDLVLVETLGEADGRAISFGRTMLPPGFKGIGDMVARTASWTAALGAFGVTDYARKTTEIIARPPTRREVDLLRISRPQPVLELRKIDIDARGNAVSYGIASFAAHRVKLVVEAEAPPSLVPPDDRRSAARRKKAAEKPPR